MTLIEFSTWGGAQWILAFWMLLNITILPLIGFQHTKKNSFEWVGWYLGRCIEVGTLAGVLAWGGFWA